MLASVDTAKAVFIVAAILFVICAVVSAIDKTIVWAIGFIGLAALAFGLWSQLSP